MTDGILAGVTDGILAGVTDGILAGVNDGILAGVTDGILAAVAVRVLADVAVGILADVTDGAVAGVVVRVLASVTYGILGGVNDSVWPLLLLPSPRRGHGLFGDCWLHNWLQFFRPSRLTWIAKREAVRLPTRLQFINRLGRPGLRNAKLFGFPPGCSFLDCEHDLREILIRH